MEAARTNWIAALSIGKITFRFASNPIYAVGVFAGVFLGFGMRVLLLCVLKSSSEALLCSFYCLTSSSLTTAYLSSE